MIVALYLLCSFLVGYLSGVLAPNVPSACALMFVLWLALTAIFLPLIERRYR